MKKANIFATLALLGMLVTGCSSRDAEAGVAFLLFLCVILSFICFALWNEQQKKSIKKGEARLFAENAAKYLAITSIAYWVCMLFFGGVAVKVMRIHIDRDVWGYMILGYVLLVNGTLAFVAKWFLDMRRQIHEKKLHATDDKEESGKE